MKEDCRSAAAMVVKSQFYRDTPRDRHLTQKTTRYAPEYLCICVPSLCSARQGTGPRMLRIQLTPPCGHICWTHHVLHEHIYSELAHLYFRNSSLSTTRDSGSTPNVQSNAPGSELFNPSN